MAYPFILRPEDGMNDEQAIATAARILYDEGHADALALLLACEAWLDWWDENEIVIWLRGDYHTVKDLLKREGRVLGELASQIRDAVDKVLPYEYSARDVRALVSPVAIEKDWRNELLNAIQGGDVHNQAVGGQSQIYIWQNLRFRSRAEMRIAQALEQAQVMFWPNCKARLGIYSARETKEADFLSVLQREVAHS